MSGEVRQRDRCFPEEVNDVSSKGRDEDGGLGQRPHQLKLQLDNARSADSCHNTRRHLRRREWNAPCHRERWWGGQNLESESVLNGFAQLNERVFYQPSARARVECVVYSVL